MGTRGDPDPPLPILIDLGAIRMIGWDLIDDFGRDADLVAGGGGYSVVMMELNPVVAALLWDGIQLLCLLAGSGLGDDCDNDNVGREAYFYESLSLEE